MTRLKYPDLINDLAIIKGETYTKLLSPSTLIWFPGDLSNAVIRGQIRDDFVENNGILLAEFYFEPPVYIPSRNKTYIYPYLKKEQTLLLPNTSKFISGRDPNIKTNHIYDIEVILDDRSYKHSFGYVQVIGEITNTETPVDYPSPTYTFLHTGDIGVSVQQYNSGIVIDPNYVHTEENYTTIEKLKLSSIEHNAQANVNANWFSSSGSSQILNKPNILRVVAVPTSSSDFGVAGDIAYDANYVYICVENSTWKRIPTSSW